MKKSLALKAIQSVCLFAQYAPPRKCFFRSQMVRVFLAATVLVAVLPSEVAAQTPTQVTWTVGNADCAGVGFSTFNFSINSTVHGSASSTNACVCNSTPLVATFTDAASLALFVPGGTNAFEMTTSPGSLALAYVRVKIDLDVGPPQEFCLFDGFVGSGGTCADRNICTAPTFTGNLPTVSGVFGPPPPRRESLPRLRSGAPMQAATQSATIPT